MNLGYRVCTPDVPSSAEPRGLTGDLEECFALLAHIGYSCVELAIADPAAVRPYVAELRASAERHGLAICALCTDPMAEARPERLLGGTKPERDAAREALIAAIELAGELECAAIVGDIAGEPDPSATPAEAMSHACAAVFGVLAERATRTGAWLLLRPTASAHSAWPGPLGRAREIVVRTNALALRLALDTAWLELGSEEFWTDLSRAAPLVRHVVLSGPEGRSPSASASALERLAVELGASRHACSWVAATTAGDGEEAARRAFAHLRQVAGR